MAFEPKKIYGSDFNGGIKYSLTDGFSPDDFNNIIEGLLYAQENGGGGGGVDQALVDQVNANTQEIGNLQSDSSRQEQSIESHTDSIHWLQEKDKDILANTDGILDIAIYKGITNNVQVPNLSSEEKASALDWLGALKKVTSTTTSTTKLRAYIINNDGSQNVEEVSHSPDGWAIARYNGGGQLSTIAPTSNNHCANKKYVDDKISNLLARIEALENK